MELKTKDVEILRAERRI